MDGLVVGSGDGNLPFRGNESRSVFNYRTGATYSTSWNTASTESTMGGSDNGNAHSSIDHSTDHRIGAI